MSYLVKDLLKSLHHTLCALTKVAMYTHMYHAWGKDLHIHVQCTHMHSTSQSLCTRLSLYGWRACSPSAMPSLETALVFASARVHAVH